MPSRKNSKRLISTDELENAMRSARKMDVKRKDIERFLSFTSVPIREDGCNIWRGATKYKAKKGAQHGKFGFRNGRVLSHRFAYEVWIGSIPEGMSVLHKCPHDSDGQCVNPLHLKLGTAKENSDDMIKAGNLVRPKGVDVHNAKLTPELVREIRGAKRTQSQRTLAKKYRISQSTVCAIVNRRIWAHVE